MPKKQLIWLGSWVVLALFLALAITIVQLRAASPVIWTGTVSTDWNTAGNWTTGIVPGVADDVLINSGTNQPTLNLTAGTVTINSLVIGNSTAIMTLTILNGAPSTNEFHTVLDLTVAAKGIITHSANTTTQINRLALKVDGIARIALGGKIDVSAKGYTAVNGPGKGTSATTTNGGSGAGHGAVGGLGTTTTVAGVSYGSSTLPVDLGSGGGSGASGIGGIGGGVIYLTSPMQINMDGSLLANGGNGAATYGGGGAGGSIYVSAPIVRGAGSVSANGGNGYATNGGGGAGGRVSVDRPGATLSVTGINPAVGGINGGQTITVTGQGFSAGALVYFRTTDVHGQTHAVSGTTTFIDSSTVTAIAPASAYYGTVEVIVVNNDLSAVQTIGGTGYQVGSTGTITPIFGSGNIMATLADSYSYYPAPLVTSSLPLSAAKTGGDTITVTGTNFRDGAAVNFSRQPATTTFVNDTTLLAVVPAGVVGSVNISVVNPDGLLSTLPSAFTYSEVAPAISAVAPSRGRVAGGQIVTATGSGFVQGVTDFTQISAGSAYSCGIANGEAYCWGIGTNGQLGNSTNVQSNTPVKVTQAPGILLDKTVTAITAGLNFACAVADGEAYCWGVGTSGQLGNSTNVQSNTPVKVTQTSGLLLGKTVTAITAGDVSACAVADGEAYCWGTNGQGQLGDASTSQRNLPVKVTQTSGLLLGKTVTAITVGNNFSCAIASGEAFCWGYNIRGQLGNNSIIQSNVPVRTTQEAGSLLGATVTAISTGANFACAVASGEAYCWGYNPQGQLGNNSIIQSNVPVRTTQYPGLLAGKIVSSISAASTYTCAVADGQAYCWGYNGYGQLGNNTTVNSSVPVSVIQTDGLLAKKTLTHISAGTNHTCSIADGEAYCFGYNNTGQLGNNTTTSSSVPVAVVTPLRGALPTISIGGAQTSLVQILSSTELRATTPAGTVGPADVVVQNYDGQSATLSGGYEYTVPPAVSSVSPNSAALTGGDSVTITGAYFTDGVTVSFGAAEATSVNRVDANTIIVTAPAHGAGIVDVAVTDRGSQVGTLSGGFTYTELVPTLSKVTPSTGPPAGGQPVTITGTGFVVGKTSIGQVSAGSNYSCGIADGEAYCWGSNANGQLGNNSTAQSTVPVKVTQTSGLLLGKTVTDISVGNNATCAVADGEVYCWGYGANGQLGNNSTAQSTVPVKVTQTSGLLLGKTVTSITGGMFSTCVIASGEAYCWGYNGWGNIGDSSSTQRNTPVKVTQTSGLLLGKTVTALSAGNVHSCAVASGEAYCWGNGYGAAPVKIVQTAGLLLDKTVTAISAGNSGTCAAADGEAYCWGSNNYGQLGNDTLTSSGNTPVKVSQLPSMLLGKTVTAIETGVAHTCAVASGEVYCWGVNSSGQLGNNSVVQSLVPVKVRQDGDILRSRVVTSISGDYNHICATADAVSYCWGANGNGQLGNNSVVQSLVPTAIDPLVNMLPTITFGGANAMSVQFISPTEIRAITPGGAAGSVDVVVQNYDNQTAPKASGYTYTSPPVITAISPGTGSTAGGNTAVITGSDLRPDTAVWFNDVQASITYVNSTTINAVVPVALGAGKANVRVINDDGRESLLSQGYDYTMAPPTITSLSPSTGPSAGSTNVTLTGTGLAAEARFVKVSSGNIHSCGLTQSGKVYCWGYNANGQLGNSSTTSSTVPMAVTDTGVLAGKVITSVVANGNYTVALDNTGKVYTWGNNAQGQLGINSTAQSTVPVSVVSTGVLADKTIVAIAAGTFHTVALDSNGIVYTWGYNSNGQLGNNSTAQSNVPVAVTTTGALSGKTISAIAAGANNTVALDSAGKVYAWGFNANGQLGNNSVAQSNTPFAVTTTGALSGKTISAIAASGYNTLALDTGGLVYAWGNNANGQLGNNSVAQSNTPFAVTNTGVLAGKTITSIAAGGNHALALDATGAVYAWGLNTSGQLGDGSTVQSNVPININSEHAFQQISGGSASTCGVAYNANIYCWGLNTNGQLGDSTAVSHSLPAIINRTAVTSEPILTNVIIGGNSTAITSGTATSLVFTTPAHALGLVDITLEPASMSPVTKSNAFEYMGPPEITSISPGSGANTGGDTVTITGSNFRPGATATFGGIAATAITIIDTNTIIATTPANNISTVDVIVTNSDSQTASLLDAFTYMQPAPVIVGITPNSGPALGNQAVTVTGTGFSSGQVDFAQISTGTNHSCGVADGEAYCWGSNNLGHSSITSSNTPVKVTQDSGLLLGKTVTSVSAGPGHTCAVADGEAYCWGSNVNGNLGDNSTVQSNVPTKVTQTSGLLQGKTVTSVAAGSNHTCAVADGEAYCWGYNTNGQRGNNSTVQSLVPTKVTQTSGLLLGKTVTTISAGIYHTCAVASGEAYCWGYDGSGNLGNNSTTQSLVPVKVTQTSGLLLGKTVTDISLSYNDHFSCAVASGAVYCWGTNGYGQLGNSSTAQSNVPVKVIQASGLLLGKTATTVRVGAQHVCAVASGEAYCWGLNSSSQLGNGSTVNSSVPIKPVQASGLLLGKTVTSVTTGGSQSCSLAGNDVYCWGQNTSGQLGNGTLVSSPVPTVSNKPYRGPSSTVTIGGAAATSVQFISPTELQAVTPAGSVGSADVTVQNYDAQSTTLTSGYEYILPPTVSGILPNTGPITGGDTVTITGSNMSNQMTVAFEGIFATNVTRVNATTLTATVPAASGPGAVDVVVTDNLGQAVTTSAGYTYTLPAPTVTSIAPNKGRESGGQQVTIAGTGFAQSVAGFTQISTGARHSCGIADNQVYCWGRNSEGQLGNSTTTQSLVPVKVTQSAGLLLGKTVTALSIGQYYSCAIADGEAYCWGQNTNGQLGNNSIAQSSVPVKVTQTSGLLLDKIVTDISSGNNFTCAIADGEAYCWGADNGYGNLGNGATIQSSVPVKVTQTSGLLLDKTVTIISAGYQHTCAIADGEAYCWGRNTSGQLGRGGGDSAVPVKVAQASGLLLGRSVTSISAGSYYHTCAIADGEAYCWGINTRGELGDNTIIRSFVPVKVTQTNGLLLGKTATTIAAGREHTCTIADNQAYCWGQNPSGQLGDNSTIQSNVPIAVIQTPGLLGNKAITNISVGNDNTCTIASSHAYCWGDNSNGQLGNNSIAQSLVPAPVTSILGVLPTITIGGVTASSIQYMSPTELRAITPVGLAGFADVFVQNYDNQNATLVSGYEYVAAPTITSILPSSSSVSGGDTATITGSNFSDPMTVTFGGVAATNIVRVNATTLTVTVPASATPGDVNVVIGDSLGQTATLMAGYTYMLPSSTISSVLPTVSKMAGGGTVTITGTGFSAKTGGGSWYEVRIGGILATNVTYVNATTLTATIPAHIPGRVDVTVSGIYSDTTSLIDSFTYVPAAYAFLNIPLNVAASEAGMLTVEARDIDGNPITSTEDIILNLSTSAGTGYFAATLEGADNWNETTISIPAGQMSANFYYKDTQQGTPTVTVTDAANTSKSQVQTIGPRYKLLVTGVSDPVSAGVPSSVTIQAIDINGVPQADYVGTVSFTVSDASALMPANYTMKVGDRGGHTFVNGMTLATPGEHCVTVTDTTYPSISGSQCDITVTAAAEGTVSQLAYLTPSQSFPLSSTSSAITIQAQDIAGSPIQTLSATPIYFYSSSATGQFSLNGETGWSSAAGFASTIPTGSTSANVFYRDTESGDYTITARDDAGTGTDLGWTNASQGITVGVGAPTKIHFNTATTGSVGQWVPVTIELQDASSNNVTAPRNVPLRLTTNATTARYSELPGGLNATASLDVIIRAGSKSVTVYVQDTTNHQVVLQASDLSPPEGGIYQSITQSLSLSAAAAVRLAFMPHPTARTYEPAALTAYLQDEYGNTVIATSTVAATFTTAAGSGGLNTTNTAPWNTSVIKNIAMGSSSATVYYRDTAVGSRTIAVSADALISATLNLEVLPLLYDPADGGQLKFTYAPTNYVAGVPQNMTVGIFDKYNNLTTAAEDVEIIFSGGGEYSIDGDVTWASSQSKTIPVGASQVSVEARNTIVSDPRYPVEQYAQQPAWPLRKISNTISVIAAAPSKYIVTSNAQTIAKNAISGAISIQLRDAYNNISPAPAGFSASITSSSLTGEFQPSAEASWSSNMTLPFVAGSTESLFYYRDSAVQTATITIAGEAMTSATQAIRIIEDFVNKAIFTTPTNAQAGEAVPITLTTQSASGIVVPVLSATTFNLTSSASGSFSLASSPWTPITNVIIPQDQSSLTLYYRATTASIVTITAAENPSQGWQDASSTMTIGSGSFYQYALTTKPTTTAVTESSSLFVVTAQDIYGNVTVATSNVPSYLYTDSDTGSFSSTSDGPWTAQSVMIPAGGSSANFYYKDMTLGRALLLHVSDQQPLESPDMGIINAVTAVEVVGQAVQKISFLTTQQIVIAGEFSSIVTVQLQKNDGSPAVQGEDLLLGMSGGGLDARYYSAPNDTSRITQLSIPAGGSSASFYVKAQESGAHPIAVSGPVTSAQPMSVLAATPAAIKFTTAVQTKQAGQESSQMTVELYDRFNNLAIMAADTNLNAGSSCADGVFSNQPGTSWNDTTQLPISSGMGTATFYYQETVTGSCVLTVSGAGLTSASQAYITTSAAAIRLSLTMKPATMSVGQVASMRASLLDVYGNIATWTGAATPLSLSTSSETGKFSPVSAVLYRGATGYSFTYSDSTIGTTDLSVRDQVGISPDIGLFDALGSVDVVEGTVTSFAISPDPLNFVAGDLGSMTVHLHNEYGAAINAKNDTTVYLLSANSSGTYKATNSLASATIDQVIIPAGQNQVIVYYQQTDAELVNLTVSADSSGVQNGPIANDMIQANVLAAEIVDTVFATPPKDLMLNQPSGPIVVQAIDEFGNVAIFASQTQLYLTSTSTTAHFSASSNFSSASYITTVTANAGSSAVSFQYQDTAVGTDTITLSDRPGGNAASGILGATQDITIYNGAPAKLAIEGGGIALERGEISSQQTIVIKNAFNATTSTDTNLTVHLTNKNNTGQFSLSPSGPWNVTQVVIPAGGSSSVPVYYRDTVLIASAYITASDVLRAPLSPEVGLIDSTKSVTISAGPFAQLAFTTAPQTTIAKHPSALMQVKAQNKYGYDTTVNVATPIYLRSTSGVGEFADNTSAWGANYVILEPSEAYNSRVSFYYRDGKEGTPIITASNALGTNPAIIRATQLQTITVQAQTGFRVANISDPQYQGTPSSVVVSAVDSEGYIIDWYAGTVSFSSPDSEAILPSSYTFDPSIDRGTHTFTNGVAFMTLGEKTVTATDGAGQTGSQLDITVVGAPPAVLSRLAFIAPNPPLLVTKSVSSDVITIQLQDWQNLPFVNSTEDTAVRLSSVSPTGEFASSPNGPWQRTLVTTVVSGLSYVNVYYRDSTAGPTTIIASDWIGSNDQVAVTNAWLAVNVQELELNEQFSIRSNNYAGTLIDNAYLFANDSLGSIEGDASLTLTAIDKVSGDLRSADWTLSLSHSQTILQEKTFNATTSFDFVSDTLSAQAGDESFMLSGTVQAGTENAIFSYEIPVSPWKTLTTAAGSVIAGDPIVTTVETRNKDILTNVENGSVRLIGEDFGEVAGTTTLLSMDRALSIGHYDVRLASADLAEGNYRVLTRLSDGSGAVLAESVSEPFTIAAKPADPAVEPTVELPPPVTPVVPGTTNPSSTAPTDPPAPAVVEAPATTKPITTNNDNSSALTAESVGPLATALNAVVAIFKDALASPAAPFVFPVLLFVLLLVMVVILFVQVYITMKRIHQVRVILDKDSRTATDKVEFLTIAAHYLRTPIAIVDGAAGMLHSSGVNPALALSASTIVQGLRAKTEQILAETSASESLHTIEKPRLGAISATIYTSPLFWLPVLASVVMTIIINWAIAGVGSHVTGVAYVEQILLFAIGGFLLYAVVHQRFVKREYQQLLQTSLEHRAALDTVKNDFVMKAYSALSTDVVGLVGIKNQLDQTDPAARMLGDGSLRLLSLMAKFETLTKIDSLQIHPSVFEAEQLVAISTAAFEQSAAQKEVSIVRTNIAQITLMQDGGLLSTVLKSVIDNAVKFSPVHGKVIVEAKQVDNEMVFTVADSGSGFDQNPEELVGMFERGEAAESVDHQGMGLSLYLNKIIMTNLGGSMSIQNNLNHGAQVTLRLPINATA